MYGVNSGASLKRGSSVCRHAWTNLIAKVVMGFACRNCRVGCYCLRHYWVNILGIMWHIVYGLCGSWSRVWRQALRKNSGPYHFMYNYKINHYTNIIVPKADHQPTTATSCWTEILSHVWSVCHLVQVDYQVLQWHWHGLWNHWYMNPSSYMV